MAGVLEGVKVLDLSRIFSGPAAAQHLGDFGADVIKVEGPTGDDVRWMGATEERLERIGGSSPLFYAYNRNKRGIILDLHLREARDVLIRLAGQADVLIHNFRPGVMEGWKLDHATLRELNPRLIYADFSAFGSVGPLANVGANDVAMQAYSGLLHMTGETDGPPVRSGSAVVDLHGGLALAMGVIAALLQREKTGEGQRVESSLLLSAADLMSYQYADYWADGTVHPRMGTANGISVPNQAFPSLDGSVIIITPGDKMWKRCAEALAPESLGIPKFATAFDRLRLKDELIAAISRVTSRLSSDELIERLNRARVNVARVNTLPEAADSEQLAAVDGTFDIVVGEHGQQVVASPVRLAAAGPTMRISPPMPGEHSGEILAELGYSDDEIAALARSGALGRALETSGDDGSASG